MGKTRACVSGDVTAKARREAGGFLKGRREAGVTPRNSKIFDLASKILEFDLCLQRDCAANWDKFGSKKDVLVNMHNFNRFPGVQSQDAISFIDI